MHQQIRLQGPIVIDSVVERLLEVLQAVSERTCKVHDVVLRLHFIAVEERDAIAVRQRMIELQVPDIPVKRGSVDEVVVARQPRDVRVGDQRNDVARVPAEPRLRNDVARERLPWSRGS